MVRKTRRLVRAGAQHPLLLQRPQSCSLLQQICDGRAGAVGQSRELRVGAGDAEEAGEGTEGEEGREARGYVGSGCATGQGEGSRGPEPQNSSSEWEGGHGSGPTVAGVDGSGLGEAVGVLEEAE